MGNEEILANVNSNALFFSSSPSVAFFSPLELTAGH
jgi:hypothetical protein